MARRVMAQYVLASTAIEYAAEHSEEVKRIVRESRLKMINAGSVYDESNLIVLEHEKAPIGSLPTVIIDVPSGREVEVQDMAYSEHVNALKARVRPTAYVIPRGLENEERILSLLTCHAVPYYSLPEGSAVMLRGYLKEECGVELTDECAVSFENGAYVFPNNLPSTVLSVLMEPDFNSVSKRKMCLCSMGLADFDESGKFPVYRYCRDLNCGKVVTV